MRPLFCCLLLLAIVAAAGCDDASNCMDCGGFLSEYLPTTSPENQIENFQMAYRKRDCQGYAKILAPEFIFKFQPLDANDIGTPFWTRDQDSTGTCALFRSGEVSEIRLNLNSSGRDSSINFPGTPLDSLNIRITPDLEVDQTDGTTWIVTDQQDMFFRKGIAANGEDPSCWFIYEWDDLPTLGSPRLSVNRPTWGRMKLLFQVAAIKGPAQ
jgi:hypothetical protein